MVTTADILGSIVGEFADEHDAPEPAFLRREDGSLLISGWMPLDELHDLTGINLPEDSQSHTAAGFVVQGFGRLPEVGDHFDPQGWRFEVLDLDGRRVDKILAEKLSRRRAR